MIVLELCPSSGKKRWAMDYYSATWASLLRSPLPIVPSLTSSAPQSLFSANAPICVPSSAYANLQDGDGEKHFLPYEASASLYLTVLVGRLMRY